MIENLEREDYLTFKDKHVWFEELKRYPSIGTYSESIIGINFTTVSTN